MLYMLVLSLRYVVTNDYKVLCASHLLVLSNRTKLYVELMLFVVVSQPHTRSPITVHPPKLKKGDHELNICKFKQCIVAHLFDSGVFKTRRPTADGPWLLFPRSRTILNQKIPLDAKPLGEKASMRGSGLHVCEGRICGPSRRCSERLMFEYIST